MLSESDEGMASFADNETNIPEEPSSLGRSYSRVSMDVGTTEIPSTDLSTMNTSQWCCIRVLSVVNLVLLIQFVASTIIILRIPRDDTAPLPIDPDTSTSNKIRFRPLPDNTAVLSRIAFGSCASQHMPQPYWDTLVQEYQPNLTLLTGDNVYGDCDDDDCTILRQAYQDFAALPSVQGAAPHLSVLATLDDHDYGANDCHGDNPYKVIAKQLFEDFFSLTNLPSDGVYQSHAWGPIGQRLQVILLDTRYERSAFVESTHGRYIPAPYNDTTRHMLSERQWTWLEEQLQDPADLRILVSSIQFLNNGTDLECWRQLPREQQRMIDLLGGKPTIIVSGDRHVGAFYQVGDLFEITASSWTHTVPYLNCSSAQECDEVDPSRTTDLVRDNNFGTVDVDWEARTYTVALRRAESTPGLAWSHKVADAGEIFDSMVYMGVF